MLNGFALNAGVLNGSGVTSQYVYLPSSTLTVDVSLAERRFVSLSGLVTQGLTLAGDISRVANLGSAPIAISYDLLGSLGRVTNIGAGSMAFAFDTTGALYTGITFGAQTLSVAYAQTGTMGTVALLPSGQSDWATAWTGSVIRTGGLAGSIDMAEAMTGTPRATLFFGSQSIDTSYTLTGSVATIQRLVGSVDIGYDLTGNLSVGQRTAIGGATLGVGFDLAGDVRGTFRIPGSVDMTLAMAGAISNLVYLGANTMPIVFDLEAALANNASEQDPAANTYTRPYNERTWVRQ